MPKSSWCRVLRRGQNYSRTQRPTVGQTAHPLGRLATDRGTAPRRTSRTLPLHPQAGTRSGDAPQVFRKASSTGCRRCWRQRLSNRRSPPGCDPAAGFDVVCAPGRHAFCGGPTRSVQNAGPLRDTTRFRHQDGDRTKRAGRVSFGRIAAAHPAPGDFQSASPSLKGMAWPVSGRRAATAGDQRPGDPRAASTEPCYAERPSAVCRAGTGGQPPAVRL